MKTPSLALLNSIGFTNPAQKVLYAAHLLHTATSASPAGIARAASPAVTTVAEVIAQSAKPFRPATAAVQGGENRGVAFGELYLNSPAYLPGTPIPAITDKPASSAVLGVPARAASAAITAINTPAIVPVKGWENSVTIDGSQVSIIQIEVFLPLISSVALAGILPNVIQEITPTSLQPTDWLGTRASNTPTTSTEVEPATLEQYFYKQVLALVGDRLISSNHRIEDVTKLVNSIPVLCKKVKINVNVSVTNFTMMPPILYLNNVSPLVY